MADTMTRADALHDSPIHSIDLLPLAHRVSSRVMDAADLSRAPLWRMNNQPIGSKVLTHL